MRPAKGPVRRHLRQNVRVVVRRYWLRDDFTTKLCGMTKYVVVAALVSIVFCTGTAGAQPVCGDVNDNGSVTSSDSLAVLRAAVGQPVDLICDACGSLCAGDPRYLL